MILVTHILIALSSLMFTTFLFLFPTKARLVTSYVLVALTLISGTLLVWTMPKHALSATVSGLIYVSIMAIAIALARKRLSRIGGPLRVKVPKD